MTYKSYPTFEDVDNRLLKCYNILQVANNIREDISEADAQKYLDCFPEDVLSSVASLCALIKHNGIEVVKQTISREYKEVGFEDSSDS